MELYYAVGGGLGHISRCLKFIQQNHFAENEIIVVGSSQYFSEQITNCRVIDISNRNIQNTKKIIADIMKRHSISHLYVDTFPFGLFGELHPILNRVSATYIARILKPAYFNMHMNKCRMMFKETLKIEKLPEAQISVINSISKKSVNIQFQNVIKPKALPDSERKKWLVVHSGPAEECELLCRYAHENAKARKEHIQLYLITQCKFNFTGAIIFNEFPAECYFDDADMIITACGYNCMLETINYAHKHLYLPFERKYDDQFFRAKLRKAMG